MGEWILTPFSIAPRCNPISFWFARFNLSPELIQHITGREPMAEAAQR